jgi:hypothetical protein
MRNYYHNVPGRLRVKMPILKGRPAGISAIEELLFDLEGIEQIKTNPLTGSVVVNYDPERIDPQQIVGLLTEHRYFDEKNAASHDEIVREAAAKAGLKIGKMIFGMAVSKTLEANGLSMLAAII